MFQHVNGIIYMSFWRHVPWTIRVQMTILYTDISVNMFLLWMWFSGIHFLHSTMAISVVFFPPLLPIPPFLLPFPSPFSIYIPPFLSHKVFLFLSRSVQFHLILLTFLPPMFHSIWGFFIPYSSDLIYLCLLPPLLPTQSLLISPSFHPCPLRISIYVSIHSKL